MKRKKTEIPSTATKYFNIAQLRTDTWNILRNSAGELDRAADSRGDARELQARIEACFSTLHIIERYFAYPGLDSLNAIEGMYERKEYKAYEHAVTDLVRILVSESYRSNAKMREPVTARKKRAKEDAADSRVRQKYFEVLVVDKLSEREQEMLREKLREMRGANEEFIYDIVVAATFQDALVAVLFNPNIQAAVIRYGAPFDSKSPLRELKPFVAGVLAMKADGQTETELGIRLGQLIADFRPELDLYYETDTAVSDVDDATLNCFHRIFYRKEDLQELHLSILQGIRERYETPFFSALMSYSQKPTGVFHAMPISRGNSIFKSRWIGDFGEFYGRNLFLAETSATTGGLDSLLQPTGPLKKAQKMAARAYGARHSFFVTNGTSTANKIVLQALVQPGDLVLIDRDCHKSHHYGLVLSGACPVYLDSYPVPEYSMYGAVPLRHIKEKLLELKEAGRLDKVKMVLLTNCTFDGIVYNVERIMEEVLAIKPDMIFLWDEAWFAFAGFTPTFRQRTGMYVARKLQKKYASPAYRAQYEEAKRSRKDAGESLALPDPDQVRIRVYSTQSTHKTLSSLRQGSMIHVYDAEFKRKAEESFDEAYMTHTSTSPNYQILASLDAGRRQVQFEGFEMVERSIDMAMVLRSKIRRHPSLRKYFDVLTVKDFIPEEYRGSGIGEYFGVETGWTRMEEAWACDEFVLDPTKINLFIGKTGVDGDTFKNKYLMDQFGIQINKTSRNTVLFMTNIGTTRSSVAYLIRVLLKISQQLEETVNAMNAEELEIHNERIRSLTVELPPLPDFSNFHPVFQSVPGVPGGNIRDAYFMAYDENNCDYIRLADCGEALRSGREIVSASFVIPYPPGFPILVPGQVLSAGILEFLIKLDVKEIHGFRSELGLRVFHDHVLGKQGNVVAGHIRAAS